MFDLKQGEEEKKGAWAAVATIFERYGMEYAPLRRQLLSMHGDADELRRPELAECRQNLLRFYHDKVKANIAGTRYPLVEEFAQIVFVLPVDTVLVESLFSIMKYNKNATRSSTGDAKVCAHNAGCMVRRFALLSHLWK